MGETSAELERELVGVRTGISATVDELERRARQVVDLKEQARDRPALVGGAGVLLLGGTSALIFRAIAKQRESRRPVNRWRRWLYGWFDHLGEQIDETHDRIEAARFGDGRSGLKMREQPGMIKTLLWMGLTAGMIALSGLLARRLSSVIWEAVMHEPPPTSKV